MKFICSFLLIYLLTACTSTNFQAHQEEGLVFINFKGGELQCLAEQDKVGQTFFLIKALKANTTLLFEDIAIKKNGTYNLHLILCIKQENTRYRSWTDVESIYIDIDPILVDTCSLKGNLIAEAPFIKVMLENHSEALPLNEIEEMMIRSSVNGKSKVS